MSYTPPQAPESPLERDEVIGVGAASAQTSRRLWPYTTAIAVLASLLVLTGVAFGIVTVNLRGDLEKETAAKVQAQTDLTNTQTQLTQARTQATGWQEVADKWRLCGVASLGISSGLLEDGLLGGLTPIGEASAKCEEARNSQTKLEGGSFA